MKRYSNKIRNSVITLRRQGKTYTEIRKITDLYITKSTLSNWCKNITLPDNYKEKIKRFNNSTLTKARLSALKARKVKQIKFNVSLIKDNQKIAKKIHSNDIAKIALSMLCLGEASKYNPKTKTAFYLGSSNYVIIILFLKLLSTFKTFDVYKIRCTVQCRSDQDTELLKKYWMKITKIPASQFYKPQIDPRTIGKPTLNEKYMGVLRVDYFDRKIQLDLESLAQLIYNQLS
jgi:hypothetical protein